eukprot:COSAG01_NODE_12462_length_1734_cov_16.568807_3_plen_95_part_00
MVAKVNQPLVALIVLCSAHRALEGLGCSILLYVIKWLSVAISHCTLHANCMCTLDWYDSTKITPTFFLARLQREPKRAKGSGYGLRPSRAGGRK